jgi:hypothetical protein
MIVKGLEKGHIEVSFETSGDGKTKTAYLYNGALYGHEADCPVEPMEFTGEILESTPEFVQDLWVVRQENSNRAAC